MDHHYIGNHHPRNHLHLHSPHYNYLQSLHCRIHTNPQPCYFHLIFIILFQLFISIFTQVMHCPLDIACFGLFIFWAFLLGMLGY